MRSLPEREINWEISEALSGLGGGVLQQEGSFIATQDRAGQDSPPDPHADKSHGRYLVSWLSRGWRGDVRERFLRFTSIPLAGLPLGLGKLAGFWFHPDPNYRQGRVSTAAIRGESCFFATTCRPPGSLAQPLSSCHRKAQTENLGPKAHIPSVDETQWQITTIWWQGRMALETLF